MTEVEMNAAKAGVSFKQSNVVMSGKYFSN